MKKTQYIIRLIIVLAVLLPARYLTAQDKLQTSPGGYHGELDFPISWKRYYRYTEWTKIMSDLQKAYPALADIESIGKSRMGRDQMLLTITAKNTGSHDSKTAMWVDGAIHGNEVNGITCSLYLAWYLLTRYDYDPYVHELVNNYTFYILPGLNVDANDSYVGYPNTPHNPREPYRPEDNDGDGLYDEDQTEDVDGDGELSYMWAEDANGNYRLSGDKKRFVQIEEEGYEGRKFRRIGSEGFDNDGDGRINEDDIGGPDPNRNYPYGWNLDAGNPYPMSESETRNVFEFQLAHPNIFASFHYHNTGRLIMFQAPPAVRNNQAGNDRMQEYRQRQLEEARKTNKYVQSYDRQVAPIYRHDMDVQTDIVTVGARILKNYDPVIGGLSGQAHAATYYMLGAYSYLIELWGSPAFAADLNDDGSVSDEEYQAWIKYDLQGDGWIDPHKVQHPDLGEIWIGGSAKKHMQRTPPSRYIEMEAEKNALFVMYCASQFPKVEIEKIDLKPVTADLYLVDVYIRNESTYPTSSDRAVQLKIAQKDKITFSGQGVELKELPGEPELQTEAGERLNLVPGARETSFRLKGKDQLVVRYLVETKGKGWMEFKATSFYGGESIKRIELK